MPIYKATNAVLKDEPCLGLYELNFKAPDQKSRHRYQIYVVIRNDEPYEFRKDMGLTSKFKKVDQFRIPGGVIDETTGRIFIEHTVGELSDIADWLRTKKAFDAVEAVGNRLHSKQKIVKPLYSY